MSLGFLYKFCLVLNLILDFENLLIDQNHVLFVGFFCLFFRTIVKCKLVPTNWVFTHSRFFNIVLLLQNLNHFVGEVE